MHRALVVGAACGLIWWGVALTLGAQTLGIVGTHAWTGAVAGACTGALVAVISTVFYRRSSLRDLYWYSPLSVYVAIAIFGLVVFVLRMLLNDFHPNQIRWAVGVQSVMGMWWGVTVLFPVVLVVHALAYANHRLLRRAVVDG